MESNKIKLGKAAYYRYAGVTVLSNAIGDKLWEDLPQSIQDEWIIAATGVESIPEKMLTDSRDGADAFVALLMSIPFKTKKEGTECGRILKEALDKAMAYLIKNQKDPLNRMGLN